MRKKTKTVEKLLVGIGYLMAGWAVMSFFGVMTTGILFSNATFWTNSLLFSLIAQMFMVPAYLAMDLLDDIEEDETPTEFKRTSGMKSVPETFNERTPIWDDR